MSSEHQVKVICFYTRKTPYEQEVIHLQNSCAQFGLDADSAFLQKPDFSLFQEIVDQIALYDVLLAKKTAKVVPLPVSYCKIFDIDTFFIDDEHVIIEQRQAPRRFK